MTASNSRRFLAAAFIVAMLPLTVPAASAQDTPDRLVALSREARTTREHADLAKRFRLQAEAFDATATELEARARSDAKTLPGIAHKWPAMTTPEMQKNKSAAVEARRAARESRMLAERHLTLAVEAQATN